MRTRDEIIDGIVTAFRAEGEQEASQPQDELDYEVIIRDTLTAKLMRLGPDELVRTCDDFSRMGIECCEPCHTFYPHYELALINLEGGGEAWICCALDRALNPQRYQKLLGFTDNREIEELFARACGTGKSEEI